MNSALSGATAAGRFRPQNLALGFVPVLVAAALGALLLPRAAPPEEIPLPTVDVRALAATSEADLRLAEEAKSTALPAEVRAVGSAMRDLNTRAARGEDDAALAEARAAISRTLEAALTAGGGDGGLAPFLALRATQLRAFVDEIRTFEDTGVQTAELEALAGPFIARMTSVGWCEGHTLSIGEAALRTAYKLAWNGVAGLDARPELAPTLDESRALYAFYLRHPHAPGETRDRIAAARRSATKGEQCDSLDQAERESAEMFRFDKLRKLATLDPAYPFAFAMGVEQYKLGHHAASAEWFRDWLRANPEGPYALRARNHLRAAMNAAGRDE